MVQSVHGSQLEAGNRSVLRCDHVWSWVPIVGVLTATDSGSRGDPRGFWLVLRDNGRVGLYKARLNRGPDLSKDPLYSVASPSDLKAELHKTSASVSFGVKRRTLRFTGRTQAPGLSWMNLLGPLGELAELGMDALEYRETKNRAKAAQAAWFPVLSGAIQWAQIQRS